MVKKEDKGFLEEALPALFSYGKFHRIRGRIILTGAAVALIVFALTYGLALGVTHGFDILDMQKKIINKCIVKNGT